MSNIPLRVTDFQSMVERWCVEEWYGMVRWLPLVGLMVVGGGTGARWAGPDSWVGGARWVGVPLGG